MANIIKPKRSATAAKVPTTADLASGELGVNMTDKKVYINNGTSVVQVGAGNLAGLGDVALSSPANGQSLQYNGTSWVNSSAGSGTVTSVAALTLGTTGTDLSSTVANGTTTPVITLNVPTASAINRGALSAADWTTFNNKGSGTVTSVTGTSPVASSGGTTPAISLASGYGDTQNPFASKTANYVLAAPSGSAGVPTFRAIVAADIPTLNQNTTGTAANITATSNSTLTTLSALSLPYSQLSGTVPTWNQNTTGTAANVTGTVAIGNGGTGAATKVLAFNALTPMTTLGDTEYHDGTNGVRLAGNTTATKKFLRQTGTGTVSAAPAWDTVTATDVGLGNVTNNAQVTSVSGTSPVVSSGGTTPAISMAAASAGVNGYMTGVYATKLDGIAAGAQPGTVTSVATSGTVSGITLTGGTITTTGTVTLGGTLAVTPSNFASQTANTFLAAPNGAAGVPTFRAVVAADIPTLNQNTTGTAANVTGTVAIGNGGTGATTAPAALTALGAYPSSNPSGYTSNTGTVTGVTATAPVVSSGGTAPAISMAAASSGVNGYMTGTYATKLDGIATGATNVTNTNQLTNGAGFITSSGSISGNAATATTATNQSGGTVAATTGTFSTYVTTSGPYYRNAAGAGYLNGQYSGVESVSTSGAIYSIGGAYVPGTTSLGNMYGIGYTYSGGAAGNPGGVPSSVWGMYVASGGTARIWLDSDNGRGYFAGNLYVNGGTQVVYNSGTWGISVTGNAATAGGFTPSQTNGTASRIVVADSNGYITNNYFNSTDNVATGMTYVMGKFGDNYLRSATAATVATFISGQTMNISGSSTSCSGNAATATTATNQSGGTVSATTLSASSTVSGTGFSNYLASPPAIGSTTANSGKFSTVAINTSGGITNASLDVLCGTAGSGSDYRILFRDDQIQAVNAANSLWQSLYLRGMYVYLTDASNTVRFSVNSGGNCYFNNNSAARSFSGYPMATPDNSCTNAIRAPGYIQWDTDIGAIGINYFTSDQRLKKNIAPTQTTAREAVDQIEFKQFDWNEYTDQDGVHVGLGVVAQQLQQVNPKFVNEMSDSTLGVNEPELLTYALKAIQELSAELKIIKAELAALKG